MINDRNHTQESNPAPSTAGAQHPVQSSGSVVKLGQILVLSVAFQVVILMQFGILALAGAAIATFTLLYLVTQFKAIAHPMESLESSLQSSTMQRQPIPVDRES